MKRIILILSLITLLSACGKKANTPAAAAASGTTEVVVKAVEPVKVVEPETFEGVYDLVEIETGDCDASIQLIKRCEGLQLQGNNFKHEEFCNINKGELKTGDNRSSTNVTLEGNVLKSVVLIFDERLTAPDNVKNTYTNTLTLEFSGKLQKLSDLKSRKSNCHYQKR